MLFVILAMRKTREITKYDNQLTLNLNTSHDISDGPAQYSVMIHSVDILCISLIDDALKQDVTDKEFPGGGVVFASTENQVRDENDDTGSVYFGEIRGLTCRKHVQCTDKKQVNEDQTPIQTGTQHDEPNEHNNPTSENDEPFSAAKGTKRKRKSGGTRKRKRGNNLLRTMLKYAFTKLCSF